MTLGAVMEKNTEHVPTSSETERTLQDDPTRVDILKSIATGALAFGIVGISPGAADAATGPATTKLDGRTLLASLERAGLNPKELNLKQLLGPRTDIAELQARLTGTGSELARASEWPDVTIVIFQKA
jgi:hypothetical protein